MKNVKSLLYIMLTILIFVSTSNSTRNTDKTRDISQRKQFLLFNIQTSFINGTVGDNIKHYDKSPFAKLIYGGSFSYDKIFSKWYALGANIGYLMNKINQTHSHAFAFSGNYSLFIKGYNKSSAYIKTELGIIKASSKDVFIFSTNENISTNFIPFYKLGLGTNGLIGKNGVLRLELFYKQILSQNKKIPEIDNYTIDSNLTIIGLAIGYGFHW